MPASTGKQQLLGRFSIFTLYTILVGVSIVGYSIAAYGIMGGHEFGKWACRLFTLLYFFWYWYDLDTNFKGTGRRIRLIELITEPISRRAIAYLDYQLIRDYGDEVALKEAIGDRPTFAACHPHGLFCMGLSLRINHGEIHVAERSLVVMTMNLHFYLPFHRDLVRALGTYGSVSEHSIVAHAQRGKMPVVMIGGVQELLASQPGEMSVVVKRRQGLFRLALQEGAALFPMLMLGENELFETADWARIPLLEKTFLNLFGFYFPMPTSLVPRPVPLRHVIGPPIIVKDRIACPSEEQISDLRDRYITALQCLFDKHKQSHDLYRRSRLTVL